jgi:hypothetical protein
LYVYNAICSLFYTGMEERSTKILQFPLILYLECKETYQGASLRKRRTQVETSLDHQVTQVSEQLGVVFKGKNNYYRYIGRQGEQITLSTENGLILVALHGLPNIPKMVTKIPQHLGSDELTDIVRRRLDMIQ